MKVRARPVPARGPVTGPSSPGSAQAQSEPSRAALPVPQRHALRRSPTVTVRATRRACDPAVRVRRRTVRRTRAALREMPGTGEDTETRSIAKDQNSFYFSILCLICFRQVPVLTTVSVWIPRRCDILTTTPTGHSPPGPDPMLLVTDTSAACLRTVTFNGYKTFVWNQGFMDQRNKIKNENNCNNYSAHSAHASSATSRPSVRASHLIRPPRLATFDLLIRLLVCHPPNEVVELGILVVRD